MGWWSPAIMGGDTPLDYKGNFEDKFGSKDPEFNEWRAQDGKEPIAYVTPTAEQTLEFLAECRNWKWHSADDEAVLCEVAGFLHMERGGTMNDELRQAILVGVDMELAEGCETWNNPQERIDILQDFRKTVEAYPAEGGEAALPHQRGLFEMFAAHTGPGLINDNVG